MNTFETRIGNLDLSLFDAVPSQTVAEERCGLLHIQRSLREQGRYVYLEIGSHLGGTIQPHYADPKCGCVYSIDKRPLSQPDERGVRYEYPENSTAKMIDNLKTAFPNADPERIVSVDADASEVPLSVVAEKPDFCFIDGEHTNAALISDMHFCLKVMNANGLVCTHDSGFVGGGIQTIRQELCDQGLPFAGMKLGGSLYAFALGDSGKRWAEVLATEIQDEDVYFKSFAFYLRRLQREARLRSCPPLLIAFRGLIRTKDWLYLNVYCRLRGRGHEGSNSED
jgi:hypothetical protein